MAIDRRTFLTGGLASLVPGGAHQGRKPNILFLLADGWRAQALPSAGDSDLRAPSLARLAKGGVHFDRAYASCPLCTPSRTSLVTGRYPHICRMPANDLALPLDEKCIGDSLRQAGYSTGYIGKWHLDGEARPGYVPPGARRRGFEYWAAFNRGHDYYNSVYFGDSPEPVRGTGFEPNYQTDLAIGFLERNKTRPFCLYLSWGPPHPPGRAPEGYARMYDPQQFRLRPNVPARYEIEAGRRHAGYYGLCSALDANIGRLLDTLEKNGLAGDTIVVFTADHGDMLGSQGLEDDNHPYEESARVPLLIRYPRRLAAGERSDLLISNVDLMPTLLSLCGVQIPEAVQGRDLSGLMTRQADSRPESVFVEGRLGTAEEWRMLVRGLDKLVVNAQLEITHLYNLGQDPYEMKNFADDKTQERKKDEMKAILRDWIFRTSDRVPYPARKHPK